MSQTETATPTTVDESTQNTATAPLTALDRCDSCGAQAYVRAVISGSELLFCAHHARAHESKLKTVAESWHDETHKLQ